MSLSIQRILRISAFSALAIAATLVTKISFFGTIIHLGSVVVITVALLFGPLEGAVVSGMSMGLYDVFFYNPASAPKIATSYLLFGLVAGYIAMSDKYIKNALVRYILAIVVGGAIYTIVYFIFNAYIMNGGLEYAQVRIMSSVITIAATFLTIPVAFALKPYVKKERK